MSPGSPMRNLTVKQLFRFLSLEIIPFLLRYHEFQSPHFGCRVITALLDRQQGEISLTNQMTAAILLFL